MGYYTVFVSISYSADSKEEDNIIINTISQKQNKIIIRSNNNINIEVAYKPETNRTVCT